MRIKLITILFIKVSYVIAIFHHHLKDKQHRLRMHNYVSAEQNTKSSFQLKCPKPSLEQWKNKVSKKYVNQSFILALATDSDKMESRQ